MIKHLENINDFDEIISSNKRVLLDFYADWCGPCQMLMPVLEEVADEQEDLIILKINTDKFGEIAMKYNIYSIPTLIYFKDGNKVDQTLGYMNKSKILNFLSK